MLALDFWLARVLLIKAKPEHVSRLPSTHHSSHLTHGESGHLHDSPSQDSSGCTSPSSLPLFHPHGFPMVPQAQPLRSGLSTSATAVPSTLNALPRWDHTGLAPSPPPHVCSKVSPSAESCPSTCPAPTSAASVFLQSTSIPSLIRHTYLSIICLPD